MKTVVIIPARGGSKRIPNKNLQLLGDITLLEHSINYAKANCDFIKDIVVTTDSKEIAKVAVTAGVKVIERPANLSGDKCTTVSALKHALLSLNNEFDVIILLQPTNPLRPASLLRDSLKEFKNGDYDSLITVSRNYHKLGKIVKNRFVPYNYNMGQRSQDLEPLYYENGLLYIMRSNIIMKDVLLGENNLAYEINHPYAKVDIDTWEDLKYAQFLYRNEELEK
ncbi:acylneuraminate cytidylyltransferase family protein [Gramella sp. KN1008]|nr:acylneuraminate cytidylyltransferase family protein [Gramella sp. KN1008]TBW25692.1 acylneuraminate cytidylyltransferase family protein [Gramella sp. KN1008]